MIQYGILAVIVAAIAVYIGIGAALFLDSEVNQKCFWEDWKGHFKVKHLLFLLLFLPGVVLGFLLSIFARAVRNFISLFRNFLNRPLFGGGKQANVYYLNPKQRDRASRNMLFVLNSLDRNNDRDRTFYRFKSLVDKSGVFHLDFITQVNRFAGLDFEMEDFFMEPGWFYQFFNAKLR